MPRGRQEEAGIHTEALNQNWLVQMLKGALGTLQKGLQVWGDRVPNSLITAPIQQGMEGKGFLRPVAGVSPSQEP